MKKVLLLVVLLLTGCTMPGLSPTPTALAKVFTETPIPPSATFLPTMTSTLTLVPSPTVPTETPTITLTPTPAWQAQGPGSVVCAILLYHRIVTPEFPNEYFVSPENFRAQMQALKDWGYTPIPMSLLVKAIKEGAPLPPRPVVISFDDGDITVYTTAFPIMQEFGYVGVNYLVGNRLGVAGYMTVEQIQALGKAGWEVGSHSMTHANLLDSKDPQWEITQSRQDLEAALGLPVPTFAYPFGVMSDDLLNRVSKYYDGAVGLGPTFEQTTNNLFYLWRRPVKYEWDIETFGKFLPWNTAP